MSKRSLIKTALEKDVDGVKKLLRTGSSLAMTDNNGWTAGHHLAYAGDIKTLEAIFDGLSHREKKELVNRRTWMEETLLLVCCQSQSNFINEKMVHLLLSWGADPNAEAHDQSSALELAISSPGNLRTVRMLRDAGAILPPECFKLAYITLDCDVVRYLLKVIDREDDNQRDEINFMMRNSVDNLNYIDVFDCVVRSSPYLDDRDIHPIVCSDEKIFYLKYLTLLARAETKMSRHDWTHTLIEFFHSNAKKEILADQTDLNDFIDVLICLQRSKVEVYYFPQVVSMLFRNTDKSGPDALVALVLCRCAELGEGNTTPPYVVSYHHTCTASDHRLFKHFPEERCNSLNLMRICRPVARSWLNERFGDPTLALSWITATKMLPPYVRKYLLYELDCPRLSLPRPLLENLP